MFGPKTANTATGQAGASWIFSWNFICLGRRRNRRRFLWRPDRLCSCWPVENLCVDNFAKSATVWKQGQEKPRLTTHMDDDSDSATNKLTFGCPPLWFYEWHSFRPQCTLCCRTNNSEADRPHSTRLDSLCHRSRESYYPNQTYKS